MRTVTDQIEAGQIVPASRSSRHSADRWSCPMSRPRPAVAGLIRKSRSDGFAGPDPARCRGQDRQITAEEASCPRHGLAREGAGPSAGARPFRLSLDVHLCLAATPLQAGLLLCRVRALPLWQRARSTCAADTPCIAGESEVTSRARPTIRKNVTSWPLLLRRHNATALRSFAAPAPIQVVVKPWRAGRQGQWSARGGDALIARGRCTSAAVRVAAFARGTRSFAGQGKQVPDAPSREAAAFTAENQGRMRLQRGGGSNAGGGHCCGPAGRP